MKIMNVNNFALLVLGIVLNVIVLFMISPISTATSYFLAVIFMFLTFRLIMYIFLGGIYHGDMERDLIYIAALIAFFDLGSKIFLQLDDGMKINFIAFCLAVILADNYLRPIFRKRIDTVIEKIDNKAELEKYMLSSKPAEELATLDKKRIAAHEIGHLIACVGYGQLPPDFYVTVGIDRKIGNATLGHVKNIVPVNKITSKSYLEIQMLIYLAGGKGAECYLGEAFNGNNDDMKRWDYHATAYFENGYGEGNYLHNPESVIEVEANNNLKANLKVRQNALLTQLFERNKAVYEEMVTQLTEKEKLLHGDIVPLMRKITVPKGYPMPFGRFIDFSDKWDKEAEYGLLP